MSAVRASEKVGCHRKDAASRISATARSGAHRRQGLLPSGEELTNGAAGGAAALDLVLELEETFDESPQQHLGELRGVALADRGPALSSWDPEQAGLEHLRLLPAVRQAETAVLKVRQQSRALQHHPEPLLLGETGVLEERPVAFLQGRMEKLTGGHRAINVFRSRQ